jgi:hypothetical protein
LTVVDAANVMGSRPDGWWRDRPGAARRLLAALAGSDLPRGGEVAVVLEGVARRAADPGPLDGVRVEHAAASGDDRIVELVAAALGADPHRVVTVVTADRGLRARVAALGARTVGPRTLWDQLGRRP